MSVATLSNTSISVQRPTVTRDAAGGKTKAWTHVSKLQGRVQPLSGDEAIRHSKDDDRVSHKVYVPGAPDVRAQDRLDVGLTGRYLYVKNAHNVDLLNHHLRILCEERDAGD